MERIGLRAVGGSGVSISPVGLGGFEVGPQSGEDPDVDRAVAVIESALGAGMNWLDTSENYLETRNESLIGEALKRIGNELIVASKVAPGTGVTGGGSGFRRRRRPTPDRGPARYATVAQVAIAWVLHQPGVTAALAGSRSPRHTQENAQSAHVALTDSLAEIERLIPLGPTFAA